MFWASDDRKWFGIGRCLILSKLYEGVDEVWLLYNLDDRKPYAAKVHCRSILSRMTAANFSADDGDVEIITEWDRASKELRILENLRGSEHVVNLRESIETSAGDRLLILEYLPHRLFTFIEDGVYNCSLTEAGIWEVAWQMLHGLSELRSKGVCHKDIKPENLLTSSVLPKQWVYQTNDGPLEQPGPEVFSATQLGHSNLLIDDLIQNDAREPPTDLPTRVVIAPVGCQDFKLKIVDFNISSESLEIYDAEGTNAFTPPEVFVKTESSFDGIERDLWSVGCTLFIAAFGKLPFWHHVPIHLQLSIINEPICWQRHLENRPDLSNDAIEFIKSLLEKNPGQRMPLDEALAIAAKHTSRHDLTGTPLS